MATITLYISDELAKKLKKVKGSLNISEIFQRAVEREINVQVENAKGGVVMATVIERLKKEKYERQDKWFPIGRKEGFKDTRELSYFELKELSFNPHVYKSLPDVVQERLEGPINDLGYRPIFPRPGYEELNREEYARGWFSAFDDFWRVVSANIDDK